MKNVAVIGAGTMGNGIAHTFAQCGYKVQLIDIAQDSLDKGMATIAKNLDRMVSKEKITEAGLDNSSAKLFPKNTVLIAMYGATIGKTAIIEREERIIDFFKFFIANLSNGSIYFI